ncbi:MAG TPA: PfkB family carbohydrate kinase [Phycisphaerae bacterium]|nr:PfkB family carbohydrate kinase [Phycisphaerae bacterium]
MSSDQSSKTVIGVGLACLDQVILWADSAEPVHAARVKDFDVQGGGMTATAMVAAARLGARAEFWGAVGDDWAGGMIIDGLAAEGVDVSQVVRVSGAQGPIVVVCVDGSTGERRFPFIQRIVDPDEPIGDLARLTDAGCVLVDGSRCASALRAAAEARRLGVPVVGDIEGINDRTRSLMAHMHYAILSAEAARRLDADLRAACEKVLAMGPTHAVVTLGPDGVVCLADGQFITADAFPVDVVDTTGAGDTFHGAFCCGLVRGLDLQTNLAFSSAVAAMKCRKIGGRAGIPNYEQVARFLVERGVSLPDDQTEI